MNKQSFNTQKNKHVVEAAPKTLHVDPWLPTSLHPIPLMANELLNYTFSCLEKGKKIKWYAEENQI